VNLLDGRRSCNYALFLLNSDPFRSTVNLKQNLVVLYEYGLEVIKNILGSNL